MQLSLLCVCVCVCLCVCMHVCIVYVCAYMRGCLQLELYRVHVLVIIIYRVMSDRDLGLSNTKEFHDTVLLDK